MYYVVFLKTASSISGLIGSAILAYRVIGVFRALHLVAKVHEENIDQLMRSNPTLVHFKNATEHVDNAKKTVLLYFGFGFIILSAFLHLVSMIVEITA